jgi:hypothetical protein
MALIEAGREPTAAELRLFGVVIAVFFGLAGAVVWWQARAPVPGIVLGAIGAAAAVVYYAVPPFRRPFFRAWMAAVFPIGWTVSNAILAATYFLVLTPIGLLMRLFRRRMIITRPEGGADTYWIKRPALAERSRYFRQF